MSVPGNEEPGVLSRQRYQSSCIPIKKREFPVFWPSSPTPDEDLPSGSDVNDADKKQEVENLDQRPPSGAEIKSDSLNVEKNFTLMVKEEKAVKPSSGEKHPSGLNFNDSNRSQDFKSTDLGPYAAMESPGKFDVGTNSVLMAEKEKVADAKVSSGNIANCLQSEKSSVTEVSGTSFNASVVTVEKDIFGLQVEGDFNVKLSMGSPNVRFSSGPKEPVLSASAHETNKDKYKRPHNLDPSLLSLSFSKEKTVTHDGSDRVSDTVITPMSANDRSNWDLNTTMDSWEVSEPSETFLHNTAVSGGFNDIHDVGSSSNLASISGFSVDRAKRNLDNVESSLNLAGIAGFSLNRAKHNLGLRSPSFSNASTQSSLQYDHADSLGLSLAMPYRDVDSIRDHSPTSGKEKSKCDDANSMSRVMMSTMNLNTANCRSVKLEPINENLVTENTVGPGGSMGLLKTNSIKREVVESHGSRIVLPSSNGPQKLVGQISIKSEVFQDNSKEARRAARAIVSESVGRLTQHQESSASSSILSNPLTPQSSCPSTLTTMSDSTRNLGKVMQHQESSGSTSVLANPLTLQNSCPLTIPTSLDSTMNQELSNQSEHSIYDKDKQSCFSKDMPDEPTDTVVSNILSHKSEQPTDKCDKIDHLKDEDLEKCNPVQHDEHPLEYCNNEEVSGGDEQKVERSTDMLEGVSFGFDHESGRNYALTSHMDEGKRPHNREDGEYEDGEFQPVVQSTVEDPIVKGKDTEKVNLIDCNTGNAENAGFSCDQKTNMSDCNGIDAAIGNLDLTNTEQIKVCVDMGSKELGNVDASLLKPLSLQEREVRIDEKKRIIVTPEKPINSPRKDVEDGNENKVSGGTATIASCRTGIMLGEGIDTSGSKSSPLHSITLPKADAAVNGNSGAKDSTIVGNKSRIINLSRASNATSPCKTRCIPPRLSSRSGKEVFSDLEGDTLQRRNRGGSFNDGPNRYTRDRVQDQSFRNPRSSEIFSRVSGRFGHLRGEQDFNSNFASESYNGPSDYWVARKKRCSIADSELECSSSYDMTPDAAMRSGRRKTLNDDSSQFHHPSLRRRLSPGGRDGPVTRAIRRIPRSISPSRHNDEDGSHLAGLRHKEKYMQNFPDDIEESGFSHPQHTYEDMDDVVFRGNRNFFQSRPKSFNQTRSPGSWSDPRRRSPDELPELTRYRSQAMRGRGRMRSPDPACFPDEIIRRRRGSPSFVARPPNNGRDAGRGHIHPRFFNSNRGSRVQEFPGSFSREQSGRIHGPRGRGAGSSDEGRKFEERQGPPRSFRPTYTDDGDNFRVHRVSDGPRPFRFRPEAERDFDGDIKHRPRMRNIEEQDGKYRDRVWDDNEFDDASGAKRRRFDMRKEY